MFSANFDDQLPRAVAILKLIHSRFFGDSTEKPSVPQLLQPNVNVTSILSKIKSDVLAGCRVAFSGETLGSCLLPVVHIVACCTYSGDYSAR
jgi:hypothetical protein